MLKRFGLVLAGLAGLTLLVGGGAVLYAAVTGEGRLVFAETPSPSLTHSTDPEVIAAGRYLVHGPAHCSQCHSSEDRARPESVKNAPLDGGLAFHMGPLGSRYAANLTPDPVTGIGRWSDAELARTLRTGVLPSGELSVLMRLSAAELSDEDLVAVLSYLRSLEPREHAVPPGTWALFGKVLLTYALGPLTPRTGPAPRHVRPSDEPSVARGAYLAGVAVCVVCHSTADPATFAPTGPKAGGGSPEASHGDDDTMEFVSPNLTSHPTGITGRLDEDAFVARLKAGRVHRSSVMPWEGVSAMTDADMRSVYRYLRTLPRVDNDVGPTYRAIGWQPQS